MLVAQLWGISRFVLDIIYPAPLCGDPDDRPSIMKDFHRYYHALTQILLAFVLATLISMCTKQIPGEKVKTISKFYYFLCYNN